MSSQHLEQNSEKFRAALVSHGEFRYGNTPVADCGSVSVKQGWAEASVRQLLDVIVVGEGITSDAYKGLRVVPVDDEGTGQPAQIMGESGKVVFGLNVHSVRFERP